MGDAGRKYLDCSEHPSANHCTLTISGTESEVLDTAVAHAVQKHGHQDSMELRSQLKSMLKDAR